MSSLSILLLPPAYLKVFSKYTLTTRKFWASPFGWNSETGQLTTSPSLIKRYRCSNIFLVVYIIYLAIFTLWFSLQKQTSQSYSLYSLLITSVSNILGTYSLFFYPVASVNIFNAVVHFVRSVEEKFKGKSQAKYLLEKYCTHIICMIMCNNFMVILSVGFIIDPDNIIHPFPAVLSKPKSTLGYLLYILVGFILEILTIFFSINNVIVWASQVLTLSTLIYSLLSELMHDESLKVLKRKYSDKLRSPRVFPRVYRSTEIIARIWIDILAFCIVPLQALAGQSGVVSCYVLIRHSSDFNAPTLLLILLIGIGMQQVWLFVLFAGGKFSDRSRQIVNSWRYIHTGKRFEKKYINRFRKSCRPIPIGLVGVYTIKKLSGPKYIYGLSKSIFRVLAAFGKS